MDDPAALYGLPLDRFVPERTALVKALRQEGRREEAARVAKLAKPSVVAWAVNQLVRTQVGALERLFEAGDALRRAHADIVAGRGGGAELRHASAVKRDALDELMRAARGLLDSQGRGLSESTLTRVSATLDAAASEDRAREEVASGSLTRELEHIGLGEGWASGAPAMPPPPRRRNRPAAPPQAAPETTPRAPPRPRERERRRGDRARAVQAARETKTARETKAAREAQAQRRRALERAERERERAQAAHDRAVQDLEAAHSRLDRATAALEAAERAVTEARAQTLPADG